MKPIKRVLLANISAIVVLNCLTAFGQGSLTPPGAPAPTMKSLDQIEPRMPVDATHTPGNNSEQFIISQPGSYYLTTNIVGVSNKDGIKIAANNVTLDLNGFSLLAASNGIYGIYISVPGSPTYGKNSIVVRNGIISGWRAFGVYSFVDGVALEHLNISGNFQDGVEFVGGGVIEDCTVSGNGGNGIYVQGYSVVSGCWIKYNEGNGIWLAGPHSAIWGNVCLGNNTGNNTNAAGIYVFGSNNRIEGNHITGSATSGNGILIYDSVDFGSVNNIVIKNSVEGNGTNNYYFGTNQIVGPIICNTATGIITNSNPWANFSF